MRKTIELRKLIDEKRQTVDRLYKAEQFDDAEKEAKELNNLNQEYKVARSLEESELKDIVDTLKPVNKRAETDDKAFHNRVFNKLLLGNKFKFAPLTDEELAYASTLDAAGTPGQVGAEGERGGYLIPTEQFNTITEMRRAYTQLKQYCTIYTVNRRSGSLPTAGAEDGKLTNFEELNEINQSNTDFGQVKFDIKDYGDIIPVSNQLLQDIDINLAQFISQRFIKKAINTENDAILTLCKALTATPITDHKGINKALNTMLDPAISSNATIFTNQTGYDYLDELEDKQGRPLLTVDITAPGQYRYRGRPIVVLKDSVFSLADKTATPFLVGSMQDFAAFFDRVGVEIAISTDALFTKGATALRAIERFDVQKVDDKALTLLSLKTTTAGGETAGGKGA